MIFYTGDLHFGNESVLIRFNRPFSDTDEMDEKMIENWNSVVSCDDTVYFLGDVGEHGKAIPEEQLSRLKGHKHLIRGNHDVGYEDQERLYRYFESVEDFCELEDQGIHILLSHYPMIHRHAGYMIHGHLHRPSEDMYEILKPLERVLNAGVDINDFRPASLQELVKNNQIYYDRPQSVLDKIHPRKMKWEAIFYPLPGRMDVK